MTVAQYDISLLIRENAVTPSITDRYCHVDREPNTDEIYMAETELSPIQRQLEDKVESELLDKGLEVSDLKCSLYYWDDRASDFTIEGSVSVDANEMDDNDIRSKLMSLSIGNGYSIKSAQCV